MIFNPKMTEKKEGRFILPQNANALAHPCLDRSVIHEFWHNFTFIKNKEMIFHLYSLRIKYAVQNKKSLFNLLSNFK